MLLFQLEQVLIMIYLTGTKLVALAAQQRKTSVRRKVAVYFSRQQHGMEIPTRIGIAAQAFYRHANIWRPLHTKRTLMIHRSSVCSLITTVPIRNMTSQSEY